MSDRVIVLYLGRIAEVQRVRDLFESPFHPYTRALLAAAPRLARDRRPVPLAVGQRVEAIPPDTGCKFAPRCAFVQAVCWSQVPDLRQVHGALVACHFAEQITGRVSTDKSPGPIKTTPTSSAGTSRTGRPAE
jgi:oligopeptide/dipeptide ABC transporter ATP-binding protein